MVKSKEGLSLELLVKNPLIPIIMFAYTIAISFLITSVAINKVTKIKPIDAILNK